MPKRKRPSQAELAQRRGFASAAQMRTLGGKIPNSDALFALPSRAQEVRQAALDSIAAVRREPTLTLAQAAQRHGVTPDTVRYWTGDTTRRRGARWEVADADRLLRPMNVYSGGQVVPIDVRGSRRASLVSDYVTAVSDFLRGADPTGAGLTRFQGVRVAGVDLETDLDALEAMADRGEFDFDSLYRVVAL